VSRRYSNFIKPYLQFGDIVALNLSFALSFYLEFSSLDELVRYPYLVLFLFVNLSWLLVTVITNPYNILRVFRFARVLRTLFATILLHLLVVSAFIAFFPYDFSRQLILTIYIFLAAVLTLNRALFVYLIRIYRKIGFNHRNVVIVGYGPIAKELSDVFTDHPEYGYKFLGYFDQKESGDAFLGKIDNIKNFVLLNNVDVVYCCLPYVDYNEIKDIIDYCEENLIKVRLLTDFRGFTYKGLELEMYDYIPVINVTPVPLDDWKNRSVKRTFDIIFSLGVIVFLLSWLIPILAILIKLDSRGPVFFKQKRSGKITQTFYCWKFRTMRQSPDADTRQATKEDPRITKFGKFLRNTSIDELPQFFNVLTGEMSVVGPRPHMIKHTEEYSKIVERFMSRHFVKPGITGLAQAKGFRGGTEDLELMKNRVKLDTFYIENWSIILDLKIILLTVSSLYKEAQQAY